MRCAIAAAPVIPRHVIPRPPQPLISPRRRHNLQCRKPWRRQRVQGRRQFHLPRAPDTQRPVPAKKASDSLLWAVPPTAPQSCIGLAAARARQHGAVFRRRPPTRRAARTNHCSSAAVRYGASGTAVGSRQMGRRRRNLSPNMAFGETLLLRCLISITSMRCAMRPLSSDAKPSAARPNPPRAH